MRWDCSWPTQRWLHSHDHCGNPVPDLVFRDKAPAHYGGCACRRNLVASSIRGHLNVDGMLFAACVGEIKAGAWPRSPWNINLFPALRSTNMSARRSRYQRRPLTRALMQLQTRSAEVQGRTLEAVSSIQTSILPPFLGTPETPILLVWPGGHPGSGCVGQARPTTKV